MAAKRLRGLNQHLADITNTQLHVPSSKRVCAQRAAAAISSQVKQCLLRGINTSLGSLESCDSHSTS